MAKVIICADDYAQSAAIDAAILTLIERGILTATSCMTLSPRWPESARQLTPQLRTKADLGLHLDFTQFSRSMRVTHPLLVVRSLTGLLSTQTVMANIKQQLDAFEDALHTPPDYIDGHLHVHQPRGTAHHFATSIQPPAPRQAAMVAHIQPPSW